MSEGTFPEQLDLRIEPMQQQSRWGMARAKRLGRNSTSPAALCRGQPWVHWSDWGIPGAGRVAMDSGSTGVTGTSLVRVKRPWSQHWAQTPLI